MTFLEEEEVFPTVNDADASVNEDVNGTGESVESKHNGKRKLEEKQTDEKDKQTDKKVSSFLFSFISLLLEDGITSMVGYLLVFKSLF